MEEQLTSSYKGDSVPPRWDIPSQPHVSWGGGGGGRIGHCASTCILLTNSGCLSSQFFIWLMRMILDRSGEHMNGIA